MSSVLSPMSFSSTVACCSRLTLRVLLCTCTEVRAVYEGWFPKCKKTYLSKSRKVHF